MLRRTGTERDNTLARSIPQRSTAGAVRKVIVLPDGQTVVSVGPGGPVFGQFSNLRSLVPVARGLNLAAPLAYANPAFFSHTLTGTEPAGTYTVSFALLTAGALNDGALGGGEVLALDTITFTVRPPITTTADLARTATSTLGPAGGFGEPPLFKLFYSAFFGDPWFGAPSRPLAAGLDGFFVDMDTALPAHQGRQIASCLADKSTLLEPGFSIDLVWQEHTTLFQNTPPGRNHCRRPRRSSNRSEVLNWRHEGADDTGTEVPAIRHSEPAARGSQSVARSLPAARSPQPVARSQ